MPTPGMSTGMGTSMAGTSGMAGGSGMGNSGMGGSAMASSGMGGSGMGMGQVGQMGPGAVPGPSQGMQPQVQQHPQVRSYSYRNCNRIYMHGEPWRDI